ncbi:MAG TPA: hypothetical protein DD643_06900 [Synechococcus sp. UBA8638]|nr:hypothetical protein [Synechococcus sp. UBA8638]
MIQQTRDLFGNAFPAINLFNETISVAANIPAFINRGLNYGMYERVGGVVREVAAGDGTVAGKIVMWLQDGQALENMVKAIPFPTISYE